MSRYRILAIDGGGLRGIIPATIIRRLNETPEIAAWLDHVDLLAGTSTGGILALALAAGLSPTRIAALYQESGPEIFCDSACDDLRDLGKLVGADYSTKPLARELEGIFKAARLHDLPRRVAVTAFDLDNEAPDDARRTWSPKIFHNFPGPDSDGDLAAATVALYTSAAPTYFPSVDGYIDGGVFANNPSMVALAQALDTRQGSEDRANLDDVVLLSLGCGQSLNFIKGKNLDWGYSQWAAPLLSLLMDGVAGIADFQCRQLLGERYHRFQITFSHHESIPMDAVNKIDRMVELAETADLTELIGWIKQVWQQPAG